MKRGRVGALILAAGLSSRMGSFKPFLEIEEKTLIERSIDLFFQAGVTTIITVAGYKAQDLKKVVTATPSEFVINERYAEGMFSSVKKGVESLRDCCDAFFLLPVDIPLVKDSTPGKLLDTFFSASYQVCYPTYLKQRGHPPLINKSLIPDILCYNGAGGLRKLLKKYEHKAIEVDVNDPFILRDIDTKEDYSALVDEVIRHRFVNLS